MSAASMFYKTELISDVGLIITTFLIFVIYDYVQKHISFNCKHIFCSVSLSALSLMLMFHPHHARGFTRDPSHAHRQNSASLHVPLPRTFAHLLTSQGRNPTAAPTLPRCYRHTHILLVLPRHTYTPNLTHHTHLQQPRRPLIPSLSLYSLARYSGFGR